MTMKVKIEHLGPASYEANVKADGEADKVLKEGESVEIYIHSTKSVTITENEAPKASAE